MTLMETDFDFSLAYVPTKSLASQNAKHCNKNLNVFSSMLNSLF